MSNYARVGSAEYMICKFRVRLPCSKYSKQTYPELIMHYLCAKDLADVAETVKTAFDDLTGVSPLWFSVEKDEEAGAGSHSLSSKCGGGGYEMFGDWRVEESLVDVFEDLPQAGSDKQVCSSYSVGLHVQQAFPATSKPMNSQERPQCFEIKAHAGKRIKECPNLSSF